MNGRDSVLASAIWPEQMRDFKPKGKDLYKHRREMARRWLGRKYLLAEPINGKHTL